MAKKKRDSKAASAKKPESLRQIYARFKREFSAADLQKYTDIGETLPFRPLLAELEAIHRKESRKRKKA